MPDKIKEADLGADLINADLISCDEPGGCYSFPGMARGYNRASLSETVKAIAEAEEKRDKGRRK